MHHRTAVPAMRLGTPSFNRQGLLCSVAAHALFFLLGIVGWFSGKPDFGPEAVYSVSLEGGASLGGISQVPKKDSKEIPTPPKNVSEKKKIEEIEKKLVEDSKPKKV